MSNKNQKNMQTTTTHNNNRRGTTTTTMASKNRAQASWLHSAFLVVIVVLAAFVGGLVPVAITTSGGSRSGGLVAAAEAHDGGASVTNTIDRPVHRTSAFVPRLGKREQSATRELLLVPASSSTMEVADGNQLKSKLLCASKFGLTTNCNSAPVMRYVKVDQLQHQQQQQPTVVLVEEEEFGMAPPNKAEAYELEQQQPLVLANEVVGTMMPSGERELVLLDEEGLVDSLIDNMMMTRETRASSSSNLRGNERNNNNNHQLVASSSAIGGGNSLLSSRLGAKRVAFTPRIGR